MWPDFDQPEEMDVDGFKGGEEPGLGVWKCGSLVVWYAISSRFGYITVSGSRLSDPHLRNLFKHLNLKELLKLTRWD